MAKVLLVEDTPECRILAVATLTHKGHEVIEAKDGSEGLEAIAQNPKIALVDYNMPVMDGYEFTRAVRTDDKYALQRDTVLIGIGDFPVNKREFLTDRRCFEKPWSLKELIEAVNEYCSV
ncbi:MAG: response regulator [Nanoarchaeota archaeon]|mgnify:CR=1 FL=1